MCVCMKKARLERAAHGWMHFFGWQETSAIVEDVKPTPEALLLVAIVCPILFLRFCPSNLLVLKILVILLPAELLASLVVPPFLHVNSKDNKCCGRQPCRD